MKTIKKLQQRIDELIVQTELGKREAAEYVNESKQKLHDHLQHLIENCETTSKPLKEKMGELQVQLKLGEMETRDACIEQREKLEESITELGAKLKERKHHASDEFHDIFDSLVDRMHLLAFNAEVAGAIAADELVLAKDKTREKLKSVSKSLKEKAEETGQKANEAAEDARSAIADIRSNLRTLFKS